MEECEEVDGGQGVRGGCGSRSGDRSGGESEEGYDSQFFKGEIGLTGVYNVFLFSYRGR